MEETLTMSNCEIDRLRVIHNVLDGKLTWQRASEELDLCIRQIGYLCARVRDKGNRGIIHRLRGKPSNHRLAAGLLDEALRYVKERYWDFGPTFANEKLLDKHKIKISTSALRKGMIEADIWKPRKQKPKHRAWRPRKERTGMLIQLDGSDHNWFEDRGPKCVLLLYIDDATSRILYGEFVHVEDTLTLLRATKKYLLICGRPLAFYVDKDTIYRINRQATIEEELRDINPLTQFTRAMEELNINVIFANSPQAKGRVERSFQTHQDRLVKELRLAGISTMEEANKFLKTTYIPNHNLKYAVKPNDPTDAHRLLLPSHNLAEILAVRSGRTLMNDWTVRFQNMFFQVLPDQPVSIRPKSKLSVEIQLDGSFHLRFKDRYLKFKKLPERPYRPFYASCKRTSAAQKPLKPYKPPPTHPWKAASYKNMLTKKQINNSLINAGSARFAT